MATEGNPPQQRRPDPAPAASSAAGARRRGRAESGRERRRTALERFIVRVVAFGGVIGVGVALGAILRSSHEQGWIIGLVVSLASVLLSFIVLWTTRRL
jgi:hypothetical protein